MDSSNVCAAELARVSVWIGEIQWMRRNGFRESCGPILKPLDAVIAPEISDEQPPSSHGSP